MTSKENNSISLTKEVPQRHLQTPISQWSRSVGVFLFFRGTCFKSTMGCPNSSPGALGKERTSKVCCLGTCWTYKDFTSTLKSRNGKLKWVGCLNIQKIVNISVCEIFFFIVIWISKSLYIGCNWFITKLTKIFRLSKQNFSANKLVYREFWNRWAI